jgi:hypothetical protein
MRIGRSSNKPRPRHLIAAALLLPLLVGLAACDDKKAEKSAAKPAVAAQAARAGNSPCSLLTVEEVAAVIGPLAGPPYRGQAGVPQPASDSCRYETPDLRSIVVEVAWKGGAEELRIMGLVQAMVKESVAGQLKLIDGTTLTGGWTDARTTGCCAFHALRDDQLVTIDVGGSRATIVQAASLADAALKRIGQPLKIDDAAGIEAARARADQRPVPRSVCALLPRAEVEAIAKAALPAEPTGNQQSCTYSLPMYGPGSEFQVTLAVDWRDGFHEMRATQAVIGSATSAMGMGKADNAADTGGAGGEVAQSIIGVLGVRRDVLISVESGPFRQDLIRALVVKALANLTGP